MADFHRETLRDDCELLSALRRLQDRPEVVEETRDEMAIWEWT